VPGVPSTTGHLTVRSAPVAQRTSQPPAPPTARREMGPADADRLTGQRGEVLTAGPAAAGATARRTGPGADAGPADRVRRPTSRPRAPGVADTTGRRPDRAAADDRAGRTAVAAWLVVVVVALAWGTAAIADADVALRAAPVMGHWRWHGDPAVVGAVLVGAAIVAAGPTLAARAPWWAVPWGAGGAAAGWTAALAAADGWHRVTEPLTTRHEYEPFASGIRDLRGFLAGYADGLRTFPVHVQGHPPGPVVLAWALDRVGLGGAGWLAALALAGWGVAVAAALVAARAVAGERAARRAAPALALLPAAVWAGTSLDALFAGLTAAAAALAIVAVTRRSARRVPCQTTFAPRHAGQIRRWLRPRQSTQIGTRVRRCEQQVPICVDRRSARAPSSCVLASDGSDSPWTRRTLPDTALAGAAGLAAGTALLFTYGAALMLLVPLAVGAVLVAAGGRRPAAGAARRQPAPHRGARPVALAAWAAGGVAAMLGMAAAAGFWWPAGVEATGTAYWGGIGRLRPAAYLTLVGNPAALALATGPAVAAGLGVAVARIRTRARAAVRTALLPAAALGAVLVADLSQMSRGETERIWLPFVPWLALAAPGDRRGWLAAQVALALVLQTTLDSPW